MKIITIDNTVFNSAQEIDQNGFITIDENPISRAGVFEYLGCSIDPQAEPNKLYKVYRPAEELQTEDTIKSFRMLPLIDDHVMLGEDGLPAEKKGVHGSTGENVQYKDGVLYSNLRIFSETLKNLISNGKKGLSLGYRCVYDKVKGNFDGQEYDYIQKDLRGNHIALVDQPRNNVYVLDSVAFDSIDLLIKTKDSKMADEDNKKEDEKEVEAKVADADADSEKEAKKEGKEDDKSESNPAMDAMDSKIKALESELASLKSNAIKSVMSEISKRDALAKDLSFHIGTFDASEKTLQEVAKYGVEKLKLQATDGHEHSVLSGFLAGRKAATVNFASDSKKVSSNIDDYINGKK